MTREELGRLRRAMRDAGITRKGEPLARVVWECAERIFAAAPAGSKPFDTAEFAYVLLKMWAADVQLEMFKSEQRRKR